MAHGSVHSAGVASYDVVGRYNQDEINGFDERTLTRLIELVDPASATEILDAMAGDGNLSERLFAFCRARGIALPNVSILEFAKIQLELARARLAPFPARFIHGDVLGMLHRDSGELLPTGSFDRVMIKSGNHEIPLAEQAQLYQSAFRVLRPGGKLINLGFLFDDAEERDEFRAIARVKDQLAGMEDAARRRHFLTRDELYPFLDDAGFRDVRAGERVEYRINSSRVASYYFKGDGGDAADLEHQAAQARARRLRQRGRIEFHGDQSVMRCPGEITVARKPTHGETHADTFQQYPYDFVRRIRVHSEMLTEVARFIPAGSHVLDLACGIGLLAERLLGAHGRYRGIDISPEYLRVCMERYGGVPGAYFEVADIEDAELGTGSFDVCTILNALYLAGLDVVKVIRKAHGALKPGGRLIVAGPTSRESFERAAPKMRAQLEEDGHLAGNEHLFEEVVKANHRLLSEDGNYWSVEGMVALLRSQGFPTTVAASSSLYYGNSYLIVVEKG